MKPLLNFTLALCLAYPSIAQRMQIRIIGSPTLSYRLASGSAEWKKLAKTIHDPRIRYDLGVMIPVFKASHAEFETGLIFSRKGLSYGDINFRDDNNNPNGSVKVVMIADFLELPFKVHYSISKSNRHYLIAGLSADFLVNDKYKFEKKSGVVNLIPTDETGVRTFNIGFHVGYRYQVTESEKFSLALEPNAKIQVLHAFKEEGNGTIRFYTIGISAKFGINL